MRIASTNDGAILFRAASLEGQMSRQSTPPFVDLKAPRFTAPYPLFVYTTWGLIGSTTMFQCRPVSRTSAQVLLGAQFGPAFPVLMWTQFAPQSVVFQIPCNDVPR